jgi:RNA polymerase sigma-70 factor, ECF subfamily
VDDAALIRGTLAGRREDFDVLVERYQRPLYAFVFRFVHEQEQTADIVQMTFLQAYTHLAQFAGRSTFKTWLHQIALNQCRAIHRTSRAQQHIPLDDVSEARLAEAGVGYGRAPADSPDPGWKPALERLIARLPLRQRSVVTLRVFKVNYHHAVTRLRQWLLENKS